MYFSLERVKLLGEEHDSKDNKHVFKKKKNRSVGMMQKSLEEIVVKILQ